MSKKEKLIQKLKSKPTDFTFYEMETLLLSFGFEKSSKGKTSGSRVRYIKGNIKITLHKPHPRNVLHAYQVLDIVNKLKKEGLI